MDYAELAELRTAAEPYLDGLSPLPESADELRAMMTIAEEGHKYWTKGKGLAKWAESPHPWTSLRDHLIKFMNPDEAKRTATEWFHEVFGFYPGSDMNRVTHGKPPRGHRVGPG